MTLSSFQRLRSQRVGVRFAPARYARLREADTNALRAGFGIRYRGDGSPTSKLSKPAHVLSRAHSACIRIPELANQQAGKANHIPSLGLRLEADRISYQCLSDKSFASAPLDLSFAPHSTPLPTLRVLQHYLAGPRRPPTIHFCWHPLSQSLVRTNLVVSPSPSIGSSLLSSRVARSQSCRLGLQQPMHLFVPSVLFGMSWSYEFHTNPQSCPPGAESRKPQRPCGPKGLAVVHS